MKSDTLTCLRNASAWLQSAANQARHDGRDDLADAIFEEAKAIMNLCGRVDEAKEARLS